MLYSFIDEVLNAVYWNFAHFYLQKTISGYGLKLVENKPIWPLI